ncbi:MAG: hypothetical protein ACI8QZ_003475 [Chlamydiales bacterium]|jgi:hypothetical protein
MGPGWTAWLLSVCAAAPVCGQTFIPPIEAVPDQLGPDGESLSLPSTLAGVHVFLEGKAGGELRREFRRVFGVHPQPAMDALILRAGTRVPPGVNAARASLRQSTRDDAVALLALEMERSKAAHELWLVRISELLEQGPLIDEDLRCAAMGAVGELRAYALAPRVALHLDDAVPRIQTAAAASLFVVYRLRFDSFAGFEAEWPRLIEMSDDPPFLRELEAEQVRARALVLRLIALSPDEVIGWLQDPDPIIRSEAAEALSRFVGEGKVGVPDAIEAMLEQLESEIDAQAFHALLHNLTDLLGGSPPGSASVVLLRGVLDRVGERRQRDLSGPILRALSRMPWDSDPASGEQSLDSGARRLVELFGSVVDRGRPLDPDLILMGIDAIETLCVRESPTEAWSDLTQPVRVGLEYLLNEYRGPEEVRLAVAGAYSGLLGDDVERILALLAGEHDFNALRYELLGALGRILPGIELDEARTRTILETLLVLTDGDQPDLCRRALEVLTSDVFTPRVAAVGSRAGSDALVERLEYETDEELRSLLLMLLGSFERPALVERLLLSPFFDDWTQGGSRNISEMAKALMSLAGDDAQVVMRAAERLLVDKKWERQADSQLVRLESALSLVASLSEEAARTLPADKHATMVRWALELREKGGARLAGTPAGGGVLERLVQVHLPGGESVVEGPKRAWALLSGDHFLARPDGSSVRDVSARYREAAARLDSTKLEYAILIRDEARFLVRVDQPLEALHAYSNLRGLEHALRAAAAADDERVGGADDDDTEGAIPVDDPVAEPIETLFELSDLRDLASLTAGVGEQEIEQRAAARDAFQLGLELVERAGWRAEPGTVRLQDLRNLADRARRSRSPALIAQVQASFSDLPEQSTPEPVPVEGEEATRADASGMPLPLWGGLVDREDWHSALLELRDEVMGEQVPEATTDSPAADGTPAPEGQLRPAPGANSSRRR